MNKVIVFHSNKGGALKTTLATNIAACLSLEKKKVLVIGCDPQGNVLSTFNQDANKLKHSLWDYYFNSDIKFEDVVVNVSSNYDVIESNREMNLLDQVVASKQAQIKRTLGKIVSEMKEKYDYIIIDTSAAHGINTVSAIKLADELVVPFRPDTYGIIGISNLLKTINESVDVTKVKITIVPTVCVASSAAHKKNINDVREKIDEIKLRGKLNINLSVNSIPQSVSVEKSIDALNLPLLLTKTNNKVTSAIRELAKEIK